MGKHASRKARRKENGFAELARLPRRVRPWGLRDICRRPEAGRVTSFAGQVLAAYQETNMVPEWAWTGRSRLMTLQTVNMRAGAPTPSPGPSRLPHKPEMDSRSWSLSNCPAFQAFLTGHLIQITSAGAPQHL